MCTLYSITINTTKAGRRVLPLREGPNPGKHHVSCSSSYYLAKITRSGLPTQVLLDLTLTLVAHTGPVVWSGQIASSSLD